VRFLLTNDDGIDAPGLAALASVIEDLGAYGTVAPRDAQSGVSHKITMSDPLRLEPAGAHGVHVLRHSLSGTPADCVRVALSHFELEPEWVIAGINRGGNLGADLYTSGTVAAAREAALFRRRAIAISQYIARDRELDWELTARRARRVLEVVLDHELAEAAFWNINLPHPDHDDADLPIVFCAADTSPLDVRYHSKGDHLYYAGSYHGRPRQPGRDVDVCFSGKVAVTKIALET
jgi:5'-nucleotidase